jgi:glutamyl-Q tRNA(Asp) synthetase
VTPVRHRGRFAPSPTGPLHLGSLLTAVASCIDARANGGEWHVRIEDIDQPRNVPGATDAILRSLARHGLRWDGPVVFQHERIDRYHAALATLDQAGLTFACNCSRSALGGAPIYPGRCRDRGLPPAPGRAIRVRVDDAQVSFEDRIQGRFGQSLARDVGDFVVRRRDGIVAYQLAVVVDDADLAVTHVVRGADLLDNTPRQCFLQRLLGLQLPIYAHVPVVANRAGEKLSKQTGATAIDDDRAAHNLLLALELLGQAPPHALAGAGVDAIVEWAVGHWRLEAIPRCGHVIPASIPL